MANSIKLVARAWLARELGKEKPDGPGTVAED